MTGRTAFYCKLFEQPGLDLYQRVGSAMNKRLIARGVLAGAVGGLVAFAFIMVSAGPIVGHAINLAGVRMQSAAVVDDHGVELFSPSMQAIGELAFVVVSFGIAMGVLLAVAFAITYAHIESVRPGALTLLLACDAFAALSLVPSIKYRAALGREAILSPCTGWYLMMVALSVVLVIGAVTLGRHIARRLETGKATVVGGGLYLAGIVAAMCLLPPVDKAPDGFLGYDQHALVFGDLGTQLVLWATVAVVFARLASTMLDAKSHRHEQMQPRRAPRR